MWSKTSLGASNFIYDDSWEEEAFAEDAAGAHGGCVWPPRSYTCSFCWREFRSAQGLGGHMNVHRRDRARLKQSQDPRHGALPQMGHPSRTGYSSFLPQIRQSFLNPIPNSSVGATATVCSPSKVICQSSKGGSLEPRKFPPYFPTFLNDMRSRLSSGDHLFPSRSNSSDRNTSETNNKLPLNQKDDFGHESRSEPTEPDFPMSLNLATRTRSSSDEVNEDATTIFDMVWKIRRTDEPSLPFLLKRKLQAVVEMDEPSYGVEEALDVKLRLGERPKKKLLRS